MKKNKSTNVIVIAIAIAIVIGVLSAICTAGSSKEEEKIQRYVLDTVPGVSQDEAKFCADAWAHGGRFVIQKYNITLECSEHSLQKTFDQQVR